MAYLIGRGAQPELIVPDSDGYAYPRGQYQMGSSDTFNIYVTPPVTQDGLVDTVGAQAYGQEFGGSMLQEYRKSRN